MLPDYHPGVYVKESNHWIWTCCNSKGMQAIGCMAAHYELRRSATEPSKENNVKRMPGKNENEYIPVPKNKGKIFMKYN